MALSLSRKLLSPEDQEKVPKDFYSAKKMINVLGLGYKKIDICVNDCFLYYDEQNKNLTACPVCGESRYEPRNMVTIRQKMFQGNLCGTFQLPQDWSNYTCLGKQQST
ncbi:hypothetical protein SLA2020_050030 [Shorea laevis]